MKQWILFVAVGVAVAMVHAGDLDVVSEGGKTGAVMRVAVELSDGSRLIGVPSLTAVPLQTSFGKMDIPLAKIVQVSLKTNRESATIELANGDKLTGALGLGAVELTTCFGKVSVGMGCVRGMQFWSGEHAGLPTKLKEALVLHFGFEKDEDGKVSDASGKGNDGRVEGAKWVRDGQRGGVLQFDGVDDHIMVADSDSLDMGNLTLAVWIHVPTYLQENGRSGWMLMEKRPHDGCWELMHFDQGRLLLRGSSPAGNMSERGAVELGKWVHVVGTIQGGEGALYVNGELVKAGAVAPVRPSSGEVLIGMGRNWHASDDHFKGFMDDVMIFNRALLADEVKAAYSAR